MRTGRRKPGLVWLGRALAMCTLALLFLPVGCGERKEQGKKATKQNRAPSVTRVEVLPYSPRLGQELRASVQTVDPDGDKVELAYQWEVNGSELEGEQESTLDSQGLRPGDEVVVRVTPFDGKTWGEPVESQPRKILGPALSKARVEIFPQPALPGDQLKAVVVSESGQGEELGLRCRWKVNGQVEQEGDSMEFSTKGLGRGNRIQAEVEMEASWGESLTVASMEITLENRPPRILSRPPEKLEAPGKYRYMVRAVDPDNDKLTFRLEGSVPPGMKIHPVTGLLEWDFREPPLEPVQVDVRVSDGHGGEAQQSYEFLVSQGQGS